MNFGHVLKVKLFLFILFTIAEIVQNENRHKSKHLTNSTNDNDNNYFLVKRRTKAENLGLNVSFICLSFTENIAKKEKNANVFYTQHLKLSILNDTMTLESDKIFMVLNLTEKEPTLTIDDPIVAEQFGLNHTIFDNYDGIKFNLAQICEIVPPILWINDSKIAQNYHLDKKEICRGFRKLDKNELDKNELNVTIFSAIFNVSVSRSNRSESRKGNFNEMIEILTQSDDNSTFNDFYYNATQSDQVLFVKSAEAAEKLNLNSSLLETHEMIGIYLPGACAPVAKPSKIIQAFNTEQLGVNVSQGIGINVDNLKTNLTELEDILHNDTSVDNILRTTNESEQRSVGGSFLLPILQEQKYDQYNPPAIFENQTVQIKIGLYIESISNFQATTMDYEMDVYLRMAWRDPRLVHNYSHPILCHDLDTLGKIWRPDPYFSNSKETNFHELTFLNYVAQVHPNGEILSEIRVKLKPSCNLVLCKFPHDVQTCHLFVRSFAYPVDTVKFHWFPNPRDAIGQNPAISLPELNIFEYSTDECDGSRATGNFSCLRFTFSLKREIGFYLAQTYIPTAFSLAFSWVAVWIPSDLMEARIGVPLTVALTLSAASVASNENLPPVSYLKAVDLWYNFINFFVFLTVVQTTVVALLDVTYESLISKAEKFKAQSETLRKSAKWYRRVRSGLDVSCRFLYPFVFLAFVMYYGFVYIQGQQDDCIKNRV